MPVELQRSNTNKMKVETRLSDERARDRETKPPEDFVHLSNSGESVIDSLLLLLLLLARGGSQRAT